MTVVVVVVCLVFTLEISIRFTRLLLSLSVSCGVTLLRELTMAASSSSSPSVFLAAAFHDAKETLLGISAKRLMAS